MPGSQRREQDLLGLGRAASKIAQRRFERRMQLDLPRRVVLG